MIDLSINKVGLEHNIQKAKENNVIIPTIAQMQNPDLIPEKIKAKLSHTGLWDVDPVNLFRISWHNEAKESGGLFQKVPNYVEIPSKLSGVPCRIVAMSGKWFPTGCHKVGASFGCLAPRLVTGQFDATYHHAVWPSTGNYCRGGAFNSKLLACESVAILPQDMSCLLYTSISLQQPWISFTAPSFSRVSSYHLPVKFTSMVTVGQTDLAPR